jgi:energy-coupling factor transport system substrate-specific component
VAAAIHDIVLYYPDTGADFWAVYTVATVLSGVVVAGIGACLLLNAIVATGVLGGFEAGRGQREV